LDSLHSVYEKRGKVLGMRRTAVRPDQQWTGAVPGEPSLCVGIESAAMDELVYRTCLMGQPWRSPAVGFVSLGR